jgi:hypothetical protein
VAINKLPKATKTKKDFHCHQGYLIKWIDCQERFDRNRLINIKTKFFSPSRSDVQFVWTNIYATTDCLNGGSGAGFLFERNNCLRLWQSEKDFSKVIGNFSKVVVYD